MPNPCDFYIYGKKMKMDEFLSYVKKMPHSELNDILGNIPSFKNIPEAPFITDTNSYVKLGLKTALKEAVKQGADKIAWTTGEQQNDRYDLSKVIENITVTNDGLHKDGYTIYKVKSEYKSGEETFGYYRAEELPNVLGKDLADKILADNLQKGEKEIYEGVDLKVGGKGMKGFYGSPTEGSLGIVGNVAKSLFKQEPKTTEIITKRLKEGNDVKNTEDVKYFSKSGFQFYEDGKPVTKQRAYEIVEKGGGKLDARFEDKSQQHSIDITPELKATVESGLPLFEDISKSKLQSLADKIEKDGLDYTLFGINKKNPNIQKMGGDFDKLFADLLRGIDKGIKTVEQAWKAIEDYYNAKKIPNDERIAKEDFVGFINDNIEVKNELPPPPPKGTEGSEGGDGGKKKSLATRLVESKNISAESKEGIKSKGLKYEPQSQAEAQEIAKAIVDEEGIDNSVMQARGNVFKGAINTLVQTEALDKLYELEKNEKDPQKKLEYAKQYAEVATELDEWARDKGQGISAINYFYKQSPLGVQMMENAKREQEFEGFAKPKEKSWKEFYDEMMKEPEFENIVKEQVNEELKKERAQERAKRRNKIIDIFDSGKITKGRAMVTIIPPPIWNGAVEVMKQLTLAGETVYSVVEAGVKYIKDNHKDKFDENAFRQEWEKKLGGVDGRGKAKTETEIAEEKRVKLLERFSKKLKGLSDKEKEQVIRKAFDKIVQNGGLEFDEFKKIIASVTGMGEMTTEQANKLKELVEKRNSVDAAAKKAMEERTNEAFIKYKASQLEAGKAARELNEMLWNKPDIIKRLTSIMQLNTLGIPALVNNPIYNLWNQATLRFPVGVINDLMDRTISVAAKLLNKNFNREYNVFETQKEFFKQLGGGLKESAEQLATGLNRQDYIQKEVYGQQIRPTKAFIDLIDNIQGKKRLSKAQVIDKALQSTVGVPAEIVARVLNLGDKPQRFGAEGAQASAFAKALGLKDVDYKLFVEFPREEAYNQYLKKGLNPVEAGQKADYIRDVIIKEGQRSTFQQDNLVNDGLNSLFDKIFGRGKKDSGVGQLAKSLTISPYIKIPINAFWSYYNLINPEVAILQAMYHGNRAYKTKNNTGNTSALQLREARYWFAHAVVGMAVRAVVLPLVAKGIFLPSNDEDDTKKEREGEANFEQQGGVNVSKLIAYLLGKDPSKVKDGLIVQNRWFGQFGSIGNSIAKKYEEMDESQKEKQNTFWNSVLGSMELDALKDLEQGVFSNSSALTQALSTKDFSYYFKNTLNMMANIVHPAMAAQVSRAQLPYYTKQKGDDFATSLKNDMLARSSMLRKLMNENPPSKVGIWGDEIPKSDNVPMRLFGFSRTNKDIFARPIYDDAKRTGNIKFFPPSIKPEISNMKLNTEQTLELEKLIGQERKKLVAPYINDYAILPIYGKVYSELSDEDKIAALDVLYKQGFENGKEKFQLNHPEFKEKQKTYQEYEKDAKKSAFSTIQKYK